MEITIKFREKGKWGNSFNECQACKTREKKHFAKGLCVACYARAYRLAVKKLKENHANFK